MPPLLWLLLAIEPAAARPRLSVECPEPIARSVWGALAEALRAWHVSDVEIDVRCWPDGAGRIETRLDGQRAIAELPPHEFGGPERVVEVAEVQVDALLTALGRPRAPAPAWVMRVGLGARAVGSAPAMPVTLSFQLDRRFGAGGDLGLLRVGVGGAFGGLEHGGRAVSLVGASAFALVGARRAGRALAIDGGLGMRGGFVSLDGAAGPPEAARDASGPWFGPILQAGVGLPYARRGEWRLGVEGGYSFEGPAAQVPEGDGLRHDGGWVALELSLSMAF